MTLSMDSVVLRRDGTLFEEADNELVAINLDNGAFYAMNPTACSIFKFIDEPRRVGDIRDHLLEAYAVEPAVCEPQMLALLQEMLAERLIDLAEAPPPASPINP